jgi:hypothetical protein
MVMVVVNGVASKAFPRTMLTARVLRECERMGGVIVATFNSGE